MLIITLDKGDTANSQIQCLGKDFGCIKDLPEKLSKNLCDCVGKATTGKPELFSILTRLLHDHPRSPYIFYGDGESAVPGAFDGALISNIKLLHWYIGPHLRARDPNRIGGSLVCCDCHQSQPQAVSADGFCKNPFCSSHAKWAEIIDGYITPENKLAKVLTCLSITHHQDESSNGAVAEHKVLVEDAFKGIPRTGSQNEWLEKANKWVQKG